MHLENHRDGNTLYCKGPPDAGLFAPGRKLIFSQRCPFVSNIDGFANFFCSWIPPRRCWWHSLTGAHFKHTHVSYLSHHLAQGQKVMLGSGANPPVAWYGVSKLHSRIHSPFLSLFGHLELWWISRRTGFSVFYFTQLKDIQIWWSLGEPLDELIHCGQAGFSVP